MLARMVLPPNCMPDSDCIFHHLPFRSHSRFFSSPLSSPARTIPLHFWYQYLRAPNLARRHASPETWRKKRYCATRRSFPVRGTSACPPTLAASPCSHLGRRFPFSFSLSLSVSLSLSGDMHPEKASDRVYYAAELTYLPCSCVE